MTTPVAAPGLMSAALERLWTKFRPDIEARVGAVEIAGRSLEAGSLTAEEREAAHAAAHKLAGVLGTFGLNRGTELARQIEIAFAEEVPAVGEAELSGWIADLRSEIEQRR